MLSSFDFRSRRVLWFVMNKSSVCLFFLRVLRFLHTETTTCACDRNVWQVLITRSRSHSSRYEINKDKLTDSLKSVHLHQSKNIKPARQKPNYMYLQLTWQKWQSTFETRTEQRQRQNILLSFSEMAACFQGNPHIECLADERDHRPASRTIHRRQVTQPEAHCQQDMFLWRYRQTTWESTFAGR